MRTKTTVSSMLVIVLLAACQTLGQTPMKWESNLEKAAKQATMSNRLVLVHFWAPWCTACIKMEQEVFSQPDVQAAIQANYVPVRLNVDHNREIAQRYGIERLPTDVVILPDGRLLERQMGFVDRYQYMTRLRQIVLDARRQPPAGLNSTTSVPVPNMNTALNTNIPQSAPPQPNANQMAMAPAVSIPAGPLPNRTNQPMAPSMPNQVAPNVPPGVYANQQPQAANPYTNQQLPTANPYSNQQPSAGNSYANQQAPVAKQYANNANPYANNNANQGGYANQSGPSQPLNQPITNWQHPAVANNVPQQQEPNLGNPLQAGPTQQQPIAQQQPITQQPIAKNAPRNETAQAPIYQGPPQAAPVNPPMANNNPTPPAKPPIAGQNPSPPEGLPGSNACPFALDGYCPVELVENKAWKIGDVRWGANHRGRTYLFSSPEQQKRFLESPDRFSPVASGTDVVLALTKKQVVPGRREFGVFCADRIFLFANEATLAAFSAEPDRYIKQLQLLDQNASRPNRPIQR